MPSTISALSPDDIAKAFTTSGEKPQISTLSPDEIEKAFVAGTAQTTAPSFVPPTDFSPTGLQRNLALNSLNQAGAPEALKSQLGTLFGGADTAETAVGDYQKTHPATPPPDSLDSLMSRENVLRNTQRVGMGNPALNGIPGTPINADAKKYGNVVSRPVIGQGPQAYTVATFEGDPTPHFYDYLGQPMRNDDPRVLSHLRAQPGATSAGEVAEGVRGGFQGAAHLLNTGVKKVATDVLPMPGPRLIEMGKKNPRIAHAVKAVQGIPAGLGNLAEGIPTFVAQGAETAASIPFALEGNRQAQDEMIATGHGLVNAAGFGRGDNGEQQGPLYKAIVQGKPVAGAGQIAQKFEEDLPMSIATLLGGFHLLRGGAIEAGKQAVDIYEGKAKAAETEASSAPSPELENQLHDQAQVYRAKADGIRQRLPASAQYAKKPVAPLSVPPVEAPEPPAEAPHAPADPGSVGDAVNKAQDQIKASEAPTTEKTPLLGDRSDNLTLDELRAQYPVPIPSDPVTDSHAALANLERDVAEGKSNLSAAGKAVDDYQRAREAGEPLPNARPPWGTPESAEPAPPETVPTRAPQPISNMADYVAAAKDGGLSDDHATYAGILADLQAHSFAEKTGNPPEDWYKQFDVQGKNPVVRSASKLVGVPDPVVEAPKVAETPKSNIPAYVQDEIDRRYAEAQKLGIDKDIEDLSSQRLTSGQTAKELTAKSGLSHADTKDLVTAVKAKLGIPSMDDRTEFEDWLNKRTTSTPEPVSSDALPRAPFQKKGIPGPPKTKDLEGAIAYPEKPEFQSVNNKDYWAEHKSSGWKSQSVRIEKRGSNGYRVTAEDGTDIAHVDTRAQANKAARENLQRQYDRYKAGRDAANAKTVPAEALSQSRTPQENKGSVELSATRRPLITLFRGKADFSTIAHESVHVAITKGLLTDAQESALHKAATDVVGLDGEKSEGFNSDRNEWTREQHETVARWYERWLYDGHAPSEALGKIFAKIKQIMQTIYDKGVKGTSIEREVPDDVRKVFEDMHTGGKGPKPADYEAMVKGDAKASLDAMNESLKPKAEAPKVEEVKPVEAPKPTEEEKPAKAGPEYVDSQNLDRMNISKEAKDIIRKNGKQERRNQGKPVTWDETRKSGQQLGIQVDHLKALPVGELPVGANGKAVDVAHFSDALGQLNAWVSEEAATAEKTYAMDKTPENEASMVQAILDYKAVADHNSYWSAKAGELLGQRNNNYTATKSERVMDLLRDAPRIDEPKPSGKPQKPVKNGARPVKAADITVSDERLQAAIDEYKRGKGQTLNQAGEAAKNPQTETPEFRRYFEGSQVVDAQGKPKPVFHSGWFDEEDNPVPEIGKEGFHFGTEAAAQERNVGKPVDDFLRALNIEEDPDTGAYHWSSEGVDSYELNEDGFGSESEARKDAEEYAQEMGDNNYGDDEGMPVTKAYLSIKNPIRIKDQAGDWTKAVQDAKAKGHDGIVYTNEFEDKGKDSYIAFKPEQIKSVNNRGTFDPNDANILHQADESDPLATIARGHYERGQTTPAKLRAAVEKSIGEPLSDADAQALHIRTVDDVRGEKEQEQRKIAKRVFVQDLTRRFKSVEKARAFVDEIADEDGSHTILNALIHELPLTDEQEAIVGAADARGRAGTGKPGQAKGGIKVLDDLRKGAAQGGKKKGTPGPPKPLPPVIRSLRASLRGNYGKFEADIEAGHPGIVERLKNGSATDADYDRAAEYSLKHSPTHATVARTEEQERLQAALKTARASANPAPEPKAPKPPKEVVPKVKLSDIPQSEQSRFGQRVKATLKDNADAFFEELRDDHRDIANVLDKNPEGLTDEQNKRLGDLFLKHAPEGKPTPAETPPLIKALNDAVKEVKDDSASAASDESPGTYKVAPEKGSGGYPGQEPPTTAQERDALKDTLTSRFGPGGFEKLQAAAPKELAKFLNAYDTMTDQEKLNLTAAINRLKRPPRNRGAEDEAVKNLRGIVADAKAGRLQYDDPVDQTRDYLMKAIPEGDTEGAVKVAKALADVERDDTGQVTYKGRQHLAEAVSRLSRQSFADNVEHFIRANLLSNPATLTKIAISHLLSASVEDLPVRAFAAGADRLLARKTGQRSVSGVSLPDTFKAVGKGLGEHNAAVETFFHGENTANLGKHTPFHDPGKALRGEFSSPVAPINAATRLAMRSHAALYRMIGSSLYDRGVREAATLASRMPGETRTAAELYANPTPEMMAHGREQYTQQMFMNKNLLNDLVTPATHSKNPLVRIPANAVIPFAKVPTNIAGRAAEYNPVGATISALKQAYDIKATGKPMTVAQQANLSRTIGRGITGTMLTYLGYELYHQHVLNAASDKDHEYGSVNAGGRKTDVAGLGPIATPVLFGAAIAKALDDIKAGKEPNYFEIAKNYFADQPLLRSAQLVPNIADPKSWQQIGANLLSEFIPASSLLRGYAAQNDPEHALRAKSGVKDMIKAGIPVLRNQLPLSRDQFGNTIPEAGNMVGLRSVPIPHPTMAHQQFHNWGEKLDELSALAKQPAYSADAIAKKQAVNAFLSDRSVKSVIAYYSDYRNKVISGEPAKIPKDLDPKTMNALIKTGDYVKRLKVTAENKDKMEQAIGEYYNRMMSGASQ